VYKERRSKRQFKAQATAEMAIMGSILIFVLGFLLSHGVSSKDRQGLEMYTFRKALQLSRENDRGINLTVIREGLSPTLSPAIGRSRMMASASVEINPWKIWQPGPGENDPNGKDSDPEDTPSWQLLQIGDAMIADKAFLKIPPTLMQVVTKEDQDKNREKDMWMWRQSSIRELGNPNEPKTFDYTYQTDINETSTGVCGSARKNTTQRLASDDIIPIPITFEYYDTSSGRNIDADYKKDDPYQGTGADEEIKAVNIRQSTVPKDIIFYQKEKIQRQRITNP